MIASGDTWHLQCCYLGGMQLLAHDVYCTLNAERTPRSEVTDAQYDVSLHVFCEDCAARDAYQEAGARGAFIAENQAN